ncbi:hypothetical protein SO694_00041010 [Aureococcus anophagefferens]|uniref:Uncharacterized protein n=1 Tax=Aureococcus anophagefferens TaxID=44056 RepID=A0ABR1G684_AURAN|nr:hypothetical protein JL722_13121 [Aureococcus anophagefferens]
MMRRGQRPRLLVALLLAASKASAPGGCPRAHPARVNPNVAVCLAGHARTFASAAVQDGLLRHLYRGAFGANFTTFLYLKLHDQSTKGATFEENQRTGIHSTHQNASHVAEWGRKLPNLAAMEVLTHHVRFTNPDRCGGGEFVRDNSTGDAWRTEETFQMLIGQIYNEYWCGEAISNYTAETGTAFDLVIKSRPDVTFTSPMPRWCAYDLEKACSARDWLFLLPGSVAVAALKRAWREFQECKTIVNQNRTRVAEIFVRASGMGKELKPHMGEPDANCRPKRKGADTPNCTRPDVMLRLIRKRDGLSGSIPGAIPKACGF